MRRLLVPLALVSVAILWGVAFVAIKESLREASPATIAVLRFGVADVVLAGILLGRPAARPRIPRGDRWRILVLGVTGVPMYHLALNWGEQRTSASVAALIVATAPVIVAVVSPMILRERLTGRGVIGITLAFSGVALLAFTGDDGGTRTQMAGFLVTLLAPLSWAIYTITAKPLTARVPSMQITITSMLVGSALLLPFVTPGMIGEIGGLSARTWGWALWLGIGSTASGYLLFNFALTHLSATRVSVAIYLVPVVALITAWAILDEPLGPIVALAAALVIAGVALTQRGGVRPAGALPPPSEEPVVARTP